MKPEFEIKGRLERLENIKHTTTEDIITIKTLKWVLNENLKKIPESEEKLISHSIDDEKIICPDCKGAYKFKDMRFINGPKEYKVVCVACSVFYDNFYCRITSISYQCPYCGKDHYADLKRTLLLETINNERWKTQGIENNSCGSFNLKIDGIMEVTTKRSK